MINRNSFRYKIEIKTLNAMTAIYCRGNHGTKKSICHECEQFLTYAGNRLYKCPFGEEKKDCAKCPVHCYARDQREVSRTIMKYSGPKMIWKHPILTFFHFYYS